MFFEGTLQEGIAKALQQSKYVVCFVTDGQSESQKWEAEFLGDDSLRAPLSTEAVVLKLEAGSAEASYLAAIFPLPKTPTLVIIKNGELKEYIAPGVSKEDFTRRTARALGVASQQPAPAPAARQPALSHTTAATSVSSPPAASLQAPASVQPTSAAPPSTSPPQGQSQGQPQEQPQVPATVQSLLSERAARLEAQREKEAEQRRLDKGKAKETPAPAKPKDAAQSKHAEELRRRQKQAREDRARVLQAIEDDKAARRAWASEREAERQRAAAAASDVLVSVRPEKKTDAEHASGDVNGTCKLQIRLADGSTVRNQFPSAAALDPDVRAWVDEQPSADGSSRRHGYGFKVILTPLPSRTISAADETKSLAELGLAPSATLVLVPSPRGAASAYPRDVGRNPVTRAVMMLVGLVTGLWALIAEFFGTLFSTAPAPTSTQGGEEGSHAAASGRESAGKEAARERRRDETQFYNGNSTNFEPRKDDEDQD